MKRNLLLVLSVLVVAAGLIVVKRRVKESDAVAHVSPDPTVILVADLSEANEPHDNCAEIIRAVREAETAGIRVSELMPGQASSLLREHQIVVAPTVLILGKDGRELNRFEGEQTSTVIAIRNRLQELRSKR